MLKRSARQGIRLSTQVFSVCLLGAVLAARGATTTVYEAPTNIAATLVVQAEDGNRLVFLGAVTNDGTLRATQGGILEFYDAVVNRGTVEAVDGTVRFHGSFTNQGVLVGTNILSVKLVPQLYFQNAVGVAARWTLDRFGVFQYSQSIGKMGRWRLIAAGDLDRDGIDDLVWQTPDGATAVWFMDENFNARRTRYLGNTGRWEVRACADSNGDGYAEIFFQEPGGCVAKWFLAPDGTFLRAEVVGQGGGWRLQAAAPRGAGLGADLYWQRPGGSVYAWLWQSNATWTVQHVGEAGPWNLCGSVDVNFDHTGDLIWQAPDTSVAGWEMQPDGVPQHFHAWDRTPGWKLRAAGHGQVAVSLNPAVAPAVDDTVGQANQWLGAGGSFATNVLCGAINVVPPGNIYTNITLQFLRGDLVGTLSNGGLRLQAP